MKYFLSIFLAVASQLALGASSFPIGPWQIGDTRSQVISQEQLGPYKPVVLDGGLDGLETKNASVLGRPAVVSFVFDGDDRLRYMRVCVYEGPNYQKAREAALAVYEQFSKDLGGATVSWVKTNGSEKIDRMGVENVLDQMFGRAPKLAEDLRKKPGVSMRVTFDMVPKDQLADSKIVAQLMYFGESDTYYIYVFKDRADLPDRRFKSMMFVDKIP